MYIIIILLISMSLLEVPLLLHSAFLQPPVENMNYSTVVDMRGGAANMAARI